ncbi:hypothetical protein PP753_gp24 [Dinoroseobacter phage vB_DshP-R7L]|uniref:Uncharacterized protein n=1 Tax=Dinoroseobacter phage vB_DshP-R7L TaxID=2873349 RepID=A0AAE8XFJ1_9CAUD|nr:hypothetical protein PP753_gp24 [Dinoroseobacter phage vB_DshP-R7L]UAT28863.1 hypothetical protein R7L_gp24 [Dinoroseobacter phage vB_DshP-R7L]
MAPPGAIPFEGVRISARTANADAKLKDLQEKYEQGIVSGDEVQQIVEILMQQGDVTLDRDFANPHRSPFDTKAKTKAVQVNRGLEKHKREHLSRELQQSAQQGDWDQIEVLVHQARQEGFLTTQEVAELDEIIGNEKYLRSLRDKISPIPMSNPLSGKGKSYADRVEGPDGWGQHVPVTRNDDNIDDIPF